MKQTTGNLAIALLTGVLFAAGLALGGMTQPSKVVGFLDFFGDWDPSLMFVMGGAVLTYAPIYHLVTRRRRAPVFAERFGIPTRTELDVRLLGGAALFGMGWGLGGFCPGPAIASLGSGTGSAVIFVVAMVSGMKLFDSLDALAKRRRANTAETPAE